MLENPPLTLAVSNSLIFQTQSRSRMFPEPISPLSQFRLLLVLGWLFCVIGCSARTEPEASFEPNLVHAFKYQYGKQGIPMKQAAKDAAWIAETMFGTPNDPRLPKVVADDQELASIVNMDRLVRASGPIQAEGRGLYRKHCVVCHGVTGNGLGPTAAVQVPYPRDYRMGVFKFKSTPRGVKPTRDDIANSIRVGIGGTAMKALREMTEDTITEEDIQSLTDYVIYLSWRGELERKRHRRWDRTGPGGGRTDPQLRICRATTGVSRTRRSARCNPRGC